IVFVDRPVAQFQADDVDVVADDNILGMELLVQHLHAYGHRRIGIVHGDLNSIHGRLRYEGALRALARFGLDPSTDLHYNGNFTFEGGSDAVYRLPGGCLRPTALLAANNNVTAGILHACRQRQIRIPQDVSVVSFGELAYAWNLIQPVITHVSQSPLL